MRLNKMVLLNLQPLNRAKIRASSYPYLPGNDSATGGGGGGKFAEPEPVTAGMKLRVRGEGC
jgi:hypothetical protein